MSNLESHDPGLEARVKEEAIFGRLPLLPSEREYSLYGISATGFAYAVATWCFLIGGYASSYVGAVQGLVVLIAGCVIGVAISAVASALACNRYGIEQIDFTKSCFGQRGSKIILVFYVINQVGWTGLILVMMARGVKNVIESAGFHPGPLFVHLVTLAGIVVAYAIIIRGVHILNMFNSIITPLLVAVCIFLFYVIFSRFGWAALVKALPLNPEPDAHVNYALAFECGLGAGFSWWPGIGFLARNTDTQRNSFYPQVITMGLLMGVVCCTGLFSGLLFQQGDPTVWMLKVGGLTFGVISLLLVASANISASSIMMYTAELALRHVKYLRGFSWKALTVITFLPLLAFVLFPDPLYERGNAFLPYNATMYVPISGVLLVDYLFLRNRRLNASQLFESHPSGDYFFTGGFNWYALGCMVLGQGLYLWLYNPVTSAYHYPFQYLTASLPAALIPMLLYYFLARIFLVKKGIGGYLEDHGSRPLLEPNI
ncbi:MAG: cytosine permease [Candidatus Eremiobacteraeota bacterium]|nr:cytosine permease [Candidatus Eremiobacteraeota bacterium]